MLRNLQVLSVGYDRNLLVSRSLLLRSSGYTVTEAYSPHQALALVRSDVIDIMLICHTVTQDERRALVSAVRKQRRLIPILCVSDTDFHLPDGDGCRIVSNSPVELLSAFDSLVRESPEAKKGPGLPQNI